MKDNESRHKIAELQLNLELLIKRINKLEAEVGDHGYDLYGPDNSLDPYNVGIKYLSCNLEYELKEIKNTQDKLIEYLDLELHKEPEKEYWRKRQKDKKV